MRSTFKSSENDSIKNSFCSIKQIQVDINDSKREKRSIFDYIPMKADPGASISLKDHARLSGNPKTT